MFVCLCVCLWTISLIISGPTGAIDLKLCTKVAFGILVSIPALHTNPSLIRPGVGDILLLVFNPPSIYTPVAQNISVKPPIFDRCTLTSGDVAIFSCMLCHSCPTLGGRLGGKFKKFQKFLSNLNISNNIYVNLNCLIWTMLYKSQPFIWHIVYACGVHSG